MTRAPADPMPHARALPPTSITLTLALAACGAAPTSSGSTGGSTAGSSTASTGAASTGDASSSSGTTGGAGPTYPPIHILFNAHGHNYGFPQGADTAPNFAQLKAQRYQAHRTEVIWLRDTAESVGARMSFQLNGEYARDARLAGDAAHIAELPARGHSVGTHFHEYVFSGSNEFWTPYTPNDATFDLVQQTWHDHITEVEMALGAPLLRVDGATIASDPNSDAWMEDLRDQFDVRIEAGGEPLSYTEWAIPPWNPYRRKRGTPLSQDPTSPLLALGGYPQIGLPQPQGLHALVTTVPQLERHFLMLLAEWREHERLGDTPRIWSIAFMSHPDQNAAYHHEVSELMAFTREYVDMVTPRGTPVAEFSSDTQLRETYLAWEAEHPGLSSFDFDWAAHLAGDLQPYPYTLEGVTLGLKDCEVTGPALTTWADQGVVAYPMARREIVRGAPDAEGRTPVLSVGDLGAPVYLLWSDAGAAVTIDFSSAEAGMLYVKDGRTGEVTQAQASALAVPEQPIVVSPSSDGLQP